MPPGFFCVTINQYASFPACLVIHIAMQSKATLHSTLACAFTCIVILLTAAAPASSNTDLAKDKGTAAPSPIAQDSTIHFADITAAANIRFVHNNGAFGKKYLPEALGPGCAFIDYDNDGYPDILLVNGQDWPGHRRAVSTLKLYHNRNGTFTDVTAKAGLAISLYGMGAAVGDYDNDGYDDIFMSALGQSRLFHNNGNGTFIDVTAAAGLGGINEFSTGAAWVDYDRDGKLDL